MVGGSGGDGSRLLVGWMSSSAAPLVQTPGNPARDVIINTATPDPPFVLRLLGGLGRVALAPLPARLQQSLRLLLGPRRIGGDRLSLSPSRRDIHFLIIIRCSPCWAGYLLALLGAKRGGAGGRSRGWS